MVQLLQWSLIAVLLNSFCECAFLFKYCKMLRPHFQRTAKEIQSLPSPSNKQARRIVVSKDSSRPRGHNLFGMFSTKSSFEMNGSCARVVVFLSNTYSFKYGLGPVKVWGGLCPKSIDQWQFYPRSDAALCICIILVNCTLCMESPFLEL